MTLVSATHVRRAYEGVSVLTDVSLDVRAGELVLLVGPSGSGKTTLLSILAGLLRPDAGDVVLAGASLAGKDEVAVARVRRGAVGFVFQSFHLLGALTALDNVAEVLAMRGAPIRSAREAARGILVEVGLGDRVTHLPRQLSSGQKQRVALARAFAGNPRVIFGDEPTASLDASTAADVMQLLRDRITADRCAVVVTHDLRLRRFADRVLELVDGRITESS